MKWSSDVLTSAIAEAGWLRSVCGVSVLGGHHADKADDGKSGDGDGFHGGWLGGLQRIQQISYRQMYTIVNYRYRILKKGWNRVRFIEMFKDMNYGKKFKSFYIFEK